MGGRKAIVLMPNVLITAAAHPGARGFCKSLENWAPDVTTIGTESNRTKAHASFTDHQYIVPRADEEGYVSSLQYIISEHSIDFIHIQSDLELLILADRLDELAVQSFLPSTEAITLCFDKFETATTLRNYGVPVPESHLIERPSDITTARDAFGLNFWLRSNTGGGGHGSLHVSDSTVYDLVEYWIDEYDGWEEFAAWEYLPGTNYGVDSLWNDGEPVVSHLKTRGNYGFSTGVFTSVTGATNVIHSVADSDERDKVLGIAHDAIRAVSDNPEGIFTVDLKGDSDDVPKVTELNPGRFLGTSGLYFGYAEHPLPEVYLDIVFGTNRAADRDMPNKRTLLRFFDQPPVLLTTSEYTKMVDENSDSFKIY